MAEPYKPPSFRVVAKGLNDVEVWYNDLKLENVVGVDVHAELNSVTEVTVRFRGVAVEYLPRPRYNTVTAGAGLTGGADLEKLGPADEG